MIVGTTALSSCWCINRLSLSSWWEVSMRGHSSGCSWRHPRCIWSVWSFVNIVLEPAFFHLSIREDHLAPAMLNPSHPLTYVHRPISPAHLSFSLSFIIHIASFIHIAGGPCKNPISMLLIVLIGPFILVHIIPLSFSPFTHPMLQAHLEFPHIRSSTLPDVLPLTIRFPSQLAPPYQICSYRRKCLHLRKYQCPLHVSNKPATLLHNGRLGYPHPTIFPRMYSISFCFRMLPFSDIRVSMSAYFHYFLYLSRLHFHAWVHWPILHHKFLHWTRCIFPYHTACLSSHPAYLFGISQ